MEGWKNESFFGNPEIWKLFDRSFLSRLSPSGNIYDPSGCMIAKLRDGEMIGEGMFGRIRRYKRLLKNGEKQYIALKTPKDPQIDLFYEAMFQARLWNELRKYSIQKVVPEIYDIMNLEKSNVVWFTMEYIPGRSLGSWVCEVIQQRGGIRYFVLLLLQLSLILEVFETGLQIDHRDLKVDNIIIVEEHIEIPIQRNGKKSSYFFPFRIVCIDFGFSCMKQKLDVKDGGGDPPIDFCPKEGRDIFQILVSLWNMKRVRDRLDRLWGTWIRERISKTTSIFPCLEYTESRNDILWLSTVTDEPEFRAPLCAPRKIIEDCFYALEK